MGPYDRLNFVPSFFQCSHFAILKFEKIFFEDFPIERFSILKSSRFKAYSFSLSSTLLPQFPVPCLKDSQILFMANRYRVNFFYNKRKSD